MSDSKIEMPRYLYRRVSLELLHQYPGQVFLRLEPWHGPVILFQIAPGDIVNISRLADRGPDSEERVTRVVAPMSGPPPPPAGPAAYCRRCASSGVGVCDDYPNCPAGRAQTR